ncbi:MAG: hypothetical protein CMB54_06715 [Euryarchaeota archaeon]|nr:hypothetical protein [Euryarchaeota archaeon]
MLIWVTLFITIAIGLFWYARHQPFPEHGNIAASIFLLTALVLYMALEAPRPTAGTLPGSPVPPVLAIILGGWFTIIGGYHMGRTQRDVIVAPFSGIILVSGIFGLVTLDWTLQTTTEQIGNFILASVFVLLEIYLLFRGLVVGIQGITWSKSGLRQLERGLIMGDRGAISHFERSWDMEDPALSAMAHAALALIYKFNDDTENYEIHANRLDRFGGWGSVDSSWLDAISTRLQGNANLESDE